MRATVVSVKVMAGRGRVPRRGGGVSTALVQPLETLFGQKLAALAVGGDQPIRPQALGDPDRVGRPSLGMRLTERLKGVPLFVVELNLLDHGFSALS